MPELPEVETIRLGLSKKIIGKKITKIELLTKSSFIGDPKLVRNKKVLKISRRAKVLSLELGQSLRAKRSNLKKQIATSPAAPRNDGYTLLFHLKMTGQLILVGNRPQATGSRFMGGHPTMDMDKELPNKSTRVIFTFNDGSKLFFNDQRRFGWVKLGDQNSDFRDQIFAKLGPEPLEKGFTWQILRQNLMRHKSMPVKVAILDQTIVGGIGNIYSSECCFNARLDPRKKVSELSDAEIKRLHKGIIKALSDGIKYGGSSMTHFFNEEGRRGYFLDYAYVYWREGEACKKCQTTIKKVQLGGRGTYWCETCQR